MSWGNLKDTGKEEAKKPLITPEEAKEIFDSSRKKSNRSPICAVVYGHDGTGKTGACMDCRTPKEVKEGKMIIVFDLDDGATPIKDEYWNNDENIVCLSPVEMMDNGDVDYIKTYDRLRVLVSYVKSLPEDSIKAVILDGLDTLKKWSEWAWKLSEGMEPTASVKDMKEWQHRNWRYNNIVVPIKNMNCDRYFITHLKANKEFRQVGGSSQLVTVDYEPDWLAGTPGMMWQKVMCEREDVNGVIILKAVLEKSKGKLGGEGREIELARVNPKTKEVKWTSHAFHELMKGEK